MLGATNILILIAFIKMNRGEYSALFCAGLYATSSLILRILFFPTRMEAGILGAGILFVISFIYFWWLKKTQDFGDMMGDFDCRTISGVYLELGLR